MRATTELQRERATDLHYPHLLGIARPEMRQRAHRLGLVKLFVEGVHLIVGLHRLVGHLFDFGALLLGQRTLPVEVEPQIAPGRFSEPA